MNRVIYFDAGTLQKPRRLPNGWLRVDAYLTRTGVFEYLNEDRKTWRRELRLDEEVFAPPTLESFASLPVTHDHPQKDGERVYLDARNTREFQRGTVESVRREGDRLAATILVTDEEAIQALESGKAQVSVGYEARLDMTSGTHQGERYDAIQRGIVANHVALVKHGRAGPDIRVRMDEAENEDAAYRAMLAQLGERSRIRTDGAERLPAVDPEDFGAVMARLGERSQVRLK